MVGRSISMWATSSQEKPTAWNTAPRAIVNLYNEGTPLEPVASFVRDEWLSGPTCQGQHPGETGSRTMRIQLED